MTDVNCLSYWFPRIARAGLPVPATQIVRAPSDLLGVLDGEKPDGWDQFIAQLKGATLGVGGMPVFLRTGHTSGKHEWVDTCFLQSRDDMERHVVRLIEESAMSGIMGLPTEVWAVREMIDTLPLFYAFRRMPITREFRYFVRDGSVTHMQPYWPPDAIRDESFPGAQALLDSASKLHGRDAAQLSSLARRAGEAVGGGYWSVDLLQDRDGHWWLTDMADGDQSFLWDPREGK